MRVIRSRLIARGVTSPLSVPSPMHHVHSLLVDAALNESRKSGAIYESGAKYTQRICRAIIFSHRAECKAQCAVRENGEAADPSLRSR
jgi:hypothetical protein